MKNSILKYAFLSITAGVTLTSCSRDFIDTEFYQSIEQRPLVSIEEMESTVRGQYNAMRAAAYYGCDFQLISEIRSNNMFTNQASGYYNTVANFSMLSNDTYATGPYTQMYRTVALANLVINNTSPTPLTWKSSADPVVIANKEKYLKGQSYAARALAFFDALRLYGQEYAGGTTGVVIPTVYNPEAEMNAGGNPAKALTYYNSILQNRILSYVPAVAVTLNDIYLERQKELVGEGFGMFDLLRRGQSITQRTTGGVAGLVRPVGTNILAFPIPRAEINVPGTPVAQNPGYSN